MSGTPLTKEIERTLNSLFCSYPGDIATVANVVVKEKGWRSR